MFERSIDHTMKVIENEMRGVDIGESESKIFVRADLPGIPEEDMEVSVSARDITITGKKPCLSDEMQQWGDKPDSFVLWKNARLCGNIETSVHLPSEVNPKSVVATLKDGVLSVEAEKVTRGTPEKVVINQTF